MIAMCCRLPSTTTSATITSADANPSPSATHARSSNQVGATRNDYTTEVGPRIRTVEPLWSPVVATGRNQWQIGPAPKPQEQAKTVAAGCDQLPFGFHGKEGVDGSSPSDGSSRLLPHLAYVLTPAATATRIAPTPAKRQAMTRISWVRLATLAGLAFVSLYVAAFTLGIEVGDSDREILAYYANSGHRTQPRSSQLVSSGQHSRTQSSAAATVSPPPIALHDRPSVERNSTASFRCAVAGAATGRSVRFVFGAESGGSLRSSMRVTTVVGMSCPF